MECVVFIHKKTNNSEGASIDEEDEVETLGKARKIWNTRKKVGLSADQDEIVIHALMEDILEKKIASKSKQKNRGRGKKKQKGNKQSENVCPL